MTSRPLDRQFLDRELLKPAVLLAPILEQGNAYFHWLNHLSSTLAGIPTVLVATHNDLTMWNLLLDEQEGLGVIDWESANAEGLPFVDFFYAIVDAITIAKTSGDRLLAFKECFATGGTYESMMRRSLAELRRVIQISDERVGLYFHACWLHHAANEYRSTGESDERPFLQLVQWLLLNRMSLCHWVHG
jgi:aminoglycoside phosphotransferase (APT) family kinase protein